VIAPLGDEDWSEGLKWLKELDISIAQAQADRAAGLLKMPEFAQGPMEQIWRRVHALSNSDWDLGFKLNMLLKFLLYSSGTKNFIPAEQLRQRLSTFLRGQFEELWNEACNLRMEQDLGRKNAGAWNSEAIINKKIITQIRLGNISDAFALAERAAVLMQLTPEVVEILQKKLPEKDDFNEKEIDLSALPKGPEISAAIVESVVRASSVARPPTSGASGWITSRTCGAVTAAVCSWS
jgi:hypothetical protein